MKFEHHYKLFDTSKLNESHQRFFIINCLLRYLFDFFNEIFKAVLLFLIS